MTRDEINQLATVKDLESLYQRLVKDISQLLSQKAVAEKAFFTPKEFSFITGMKYSTVIYRCKIGKLKARQDSPNCSWLISGEEVERFKSESQDNAA